MTEQTDPLEALRQPFHAEAIGKLPRVTCKDCSSSSGRVCNRHEKKECPGCHNWMTTAHIHLDYVGHAAVTDRLLRVDPEWSWEPMAYDAAGLPAVSHSGSEAELWIKLTVCGVTRPGVGTCASNSFERSKQLIGDALRNAAMRFGVALDLWSKEELHPPETQPEQAPRPAQRQRQAAKPTDVPCIPAESADAMLRALNDVVDDNRRTGLKRRFADKFGTPAALPAPIETGAWEWLAKELEVAVHPALLDAEAICGSCGTTVVAPWHTAEEGRSTAPTPADEPTATHSPESEDVSAAAAPLTREWIEQATKPELLARLTALGMGTEGTLPTLRTRLFASTEPAPAS